MADKRTQEQADNSNMQKNPDDWTTGDEPMTGAQLSYLKTLSEEANEPVDENLIDDARRENAFGLLMSLNMLIEFGDAFDFAAADFFGWCREAGFSRTEVIPLAGPASAGVAYK